VFSLRYGLNSLFRQDSPSEGCPRRKIKCLSLHLLISSLNLFFIYPSHLSLSQRVQQDVGWALGWRRVVTASVVNMKMCWLLECIWSIKWFMFLDVFICLLAKNTYCPHTRRKSLLGLRYTRVRKISRRVTSCYYPFWKHLCHIHWANNGR
jgi:hypothetical protein